MTNTQALVVAENPLQHEIVFKLQYQPYAANAYIGIVNKLKAGLYSETTAPHLLKTPKSTMKPTPMQ